MGTVFWYHRGVNDTYRSGCCESAYQIRVQTHDNLLGVIAFVFCQILDGSANNFVAVPDANTLLRTPISSPPALVGAFLRRSSLLAGARRAGIYLPQAHPTDFFAQGGSKPARCCGGGDDRVGRDRVVALMLGLAGVLRTAQLPQLRSTRLYEPVGCMTECTMLQVAARLGWWREVCPGNTSKSWLYPFYWGC